MPQIIGYCRVSTDGQTLDDQIAALRAAGATRMFAEKESGARTDRPQLRKAIATLGTGDTLIVTRLDRLARSTRDLLNVLHDVGEAGASFRSLADHWADTTTPHGRLMVTVLGGLAEFERSLIKARTDVGIARARADGVRFGRPPKLTPHQQQHAIRLLGDGEPQSAVARALNVDQSTISRLFMASTCPLSRD
jgi:DNA invertase Pin-like site-specific DNA recombinase